MSRDYEELLGNVPEDKVFWLRNSEGIHNLKELLVSLRNMDDETFKFHVNKDKNDFKEWIIHVLKDAKLAKDISRLKKKDKFIVQVKKRIKTLQRGIQRKKKKNN